MFALAVQIADLRREELLRDAELERRARLARGAQPRVPRWRRGAGRALGAVSVALAALAQRADPASGRARRTHLDLAH